MQCWALNDKGGETSAIRLATHVWHCLDFHVEIRTSMLSRERQKSLACWLVSARVKVNAVHCTPTAMQEDIADLAQLWLLNIGELAQLGLLLIL